MTYSKTAPRAPRPPRSRQASPPRPTPAPNPFDAASLDELDWDDEVELAPEPLEPAERRPRKHRSIVPPRPVDSSPPPARRFAESGTAYPPYPAWEHQPAGGLKRHTVPPFAAATNLAAPSSDRVETLPPPLDDEPTCLDVNRLIQNAMQEAHGHVAPPPLTPPPPFQGAGDTLSPSARSIPAPPAAPKPRRGVAFAVAAAGTLVGAAAAVAIVSLYVARTAPAVQCEPTLAALSTSAAAFVGQKSEAVSSTPVAPPALPSDRACKVVGEKKQLLSSASTTVPMEAAVDADAGRAAIALAASNGRPVGFALRLDTLRTERSTMDWAPAPLLRVVPMLGEDLSVVPDLDSKDQDGLSYTVRSTVPLKLGTFRGHLTLTQDAKLPEVLWSVPGDVSAVDAVADRDGDAAIVVRSSNRVVLGFADKMQRPDGALLEVSDDFDATGTVRVAREGSQAAVAFEVHTKTGHSITVVSVENGKRSATWSPALPDATANQQPGIASLSDGRWLLTWTERGASSSKVRMQTLDRWLRPVGATEDVTAEGDGASGSVVATVRDGGVVFYFKRGASPREAWVAPIRCP